MPGRLPIFERSPTTFWSGCPLGLQGGTAATLEGTSPDSYPALGSNYLPLKNPT
jgi:hypothetical protein